MSEIFKNWDIRRAHEDITLYGLLENGIEARKVVISTQEGSAYLRALKQNEKIPQDSSCGQITRKIPRATSTIIPCW